jgi:hypothetical protein
MTAPLETIASDGVADGQREKAEAEGKHDKIEHGRSLWFSGASGK